MGDESTDLDTLIIGAGIAGLWLHNRLSSLGYSSLLLEGKAIGCGQSVASQGIIHSGLKYALAGQVNDLARSISAMPDRWRAALHGKGDVDLRTARSLAQSQIMMIPKGFMGGLIKVIAKRTLGHGVREIERQSWPTPLQESGFKGQAIFMSEPVLDVPSVLRALAQPYRATIRQASAHDMRFEGETVYIGERRIKARHIILTAAASNHEIARALGHDKGLKTQTRPLLMGWLRPAPFPLYAHLVGASDKPVATITTHTDDQGRLVWYLGAQVAERAKEAPAQEVYDSAKKAFAHYLPHIDFSDVEWRAHPVDRIEGQSDTDGWLPDTPVIHSHGNYHYCWPTKLTFAPMLGDKILAKIGAPSAARSDLIDFSYLPEAPLAPAIWDRDDE